MKEHVLATRYHTLGCAIPMKYRGSVSQDRSWQTALCFLLTPGQESCSELHPVLELRQHSAPVTISQRNFSFPGQTSVGHCVLMEVSPLEKTTSNLRFTSDPTQIIQKNKNFCIVKTKACALTLPKMQVLFFFQSQAHCSCYFGSRESIPTLRRHSAQFISRINPVSYARDNLAHIALS